MRVMYIIPRYHTNLIPTVNGWIQNKHEVMVVTHAKGRIEDYSLVEPVVAGYSGIFKAFLALYVNVIARKNPIAGDIAFRVGFPSGRVIKKLLREFAPDLVILREKSFYTMTCTRICRKMGVKTLLYNQSPVWGDESFFKDDFAHRLVNKRCPEKRITPVNQVGYGLEGKINGDKAQFAPFVMDLGIKPDDKKHFEDGVINILEIGKYEKRKNHYMMVDAFARLCKTRDDIRLTIVGEKTSMFHEEYYENLQKYIDELGMKERIVCKFNLFRYEMTQEYSKADLFVLPSTGEPAAISCIEAMSNSVAAICGTGNGTADYIVPGETGYIFKDKDADDLYSKISEAISDRDRLVEMGANGYKRVEEYCSFDKYYEAIKATGVIG